MNEVNDTERFPPVSRESLAPEGQAVWDARVKAINNAPTGHFNVMMHVPRLCALIQDLESYFRFESVISDRDRELIILAVVRESQARFAWARHERTALARGVPREVVDALRSRAPLETFPPAERLLVEFARALAGAREQLPEQLFQRVLAERGQRWIIEGIALCGHYSMVGVLIHGYGVQARAADAPTF